MDDVNLGGRGGLKVVCVDSYIIPVLGTAFRKFCASESDLPSGGIERAIPCEPFGSGPPPTHVRTHQHPDMMVLGRLRWHGYEIEQHSESEARRNYLLHRAHGIRPQVQGGASALN